METMRGGDGLPLVFDNFGWDSQRETPRFAASSLREKDSSCIESFYIESLSALPHLKPTVFDALILIASPVCGLRPVRALRSRTENDPKPTSATFLSFLRPDSIPSRTTPSARSAAVRVSPTLP